jgi:hypothetical protein
VPGKELKLVHKLMAPYCPVDQVQRREFPPQAALSYQVYLTSIFTCANTWCFNFGFSDGSKTNYYTSGEKMEEVKITG